MTLQNPLLALLQPGRAVSGSLSPGSRYATVGIAELERPDGEKIVYLRRRILPQPETLVLAATHRMEQAERLDHVAAHSLGDPELFWRLLDANPVLRAEELEVTGRRLRITLPEGSPDVGGLGGAGDAS